MAMFEFLKQRDRTPRTLPEGTVRRRYRIWGQVQGVGFRYRAKYAAQQLDLAGWVENKDDGTVELEVQGRLEQIRKLFGMIQASDYIQITGMRQEDLTPDPYARGFSVRGY
ncbi:MAG: acylphosphatase [Candidatus Faecalibacterium intestinavium]|uniref:acylphosphatase n=1 Tax=Candidatus Faecalibacterium intestinavium TaxID=2838580 RepID=A0A9E2NR84_9FIRM|nr:acylphosphatase [Candidatus Faecalibacterium intestinavium]